MDTTKENILMCEKSVEVQDHTATSGDIYRICIVEEYEIHEKNPALGNLVRLQNCTGFETKGDELKFSTVFKGLLAFDFIGNHVKEYGKKYTWLPRQDQLQHMVNPNKLAVCLLMSEFNKWHNDYSKDLITYRFTSMEQLWLAFVMHKKYGKKWDGEEWIS